MRSKSWTVIFAGLIAAAAAHAQAAPTKHTAPHKTTPSTTHAAAYDPALLHPASLTAKAPDEFEVKFTTTAGDFTVKVTRAWAPLGADRFYNLVRHHFFNGAAFFRVVPGFIVQFGISAYPQVAAAWRNAPIKDDPVAKTNHISYLTFATAGPNTRTTQLFINFRENAQLDSQGFAPFGEVTQGMDIVEKIYAGYRETPDQGEIESRGAGYLAPNFPKLDTIRTTTIISPAQAPSKTPAKTPGKSGS